MTMVRKDTKVGHLPSLLLILIALCLPLTAFAEVIVKNVRSSVNAARTRLVFDLSAAARYQLLTLKSPDRLVVDIEGGHWQEGHELALPPNSVVQDARVGQHQGQYLRMVFDLKHAVKVSAFTLEPIDGYGHRLVLDLTTTQQPAAKLVAKTATEIKQAKPIAAVKKMVTKIAAPVSVKITEPKPKNLRDIIIVIDPGHGGKDPGATGPAGYHEKDVVLKISRMLQDMLNKEPGFRAVLTRNSDYYITLRGRLAIASQDKADMFIAIHADAYRNSDAIGASVFALSERGATSEAARWLANRENRSELSGGVDLADKDNALRSVLINLAQTNTIAESLKMGNSILQQLSRVTRLHHYRVEQAAFVVLKSPDIPSLLVETGFLSNPSEERRLITPDYQYKIAQALMLGVKGYFMNHPPPGTILAARMNGVKGA